MSLGGEHYDEYNQFNYVIVGQKRSFTPYPTTSLTAILADARCRTVGTCSRVRHDFDTCNVIIQKVSPLELCKAGSPV